MRGNLPQIMGWIGCTTKTVLRRKKRRGNVRVVRRPKDPLYLSRPTTSCGVADLSWALLGGYGLKRGVQVHLGPSQRRKEADFCSRDEILAARRPVPALARTTRPRKKRARAASGAGTSTKTLLATRTGVVRACTWSFGASSFPRPKSSSARAKTNQRRLVVLKACRFTGTFRHLECRAHV